MQGPAWCVISKMLIEVHAGVLRKFLGADSIKVILVKLSTRHFFCHHNMHIAAGD